MIYKLTFSEAITKCKFIKTFEINHRGIPGECISVCYADFAIHNLKIMFWKCTKRDQYDQFELRVIDLTNLKPGMDDELFGLSFEKTSEESS